MKSGKVTKGKYTIEIRNLIIIEEPSRSSIRSKKNEMKCFRNKLLLKYCSLSNDKQKLFD